MPEQEFHLIETKKMKAGDCEDHPRNPNTHSEFQKAVVAQSVNLSGQLDELKAYYSADNGGKLTLFNGHCRKWLDPEKVWNINVYDIDDDTAAGYMLVHDPSARLAGTNNEHVNELRLRSSIDAAETEAEQIVQMIDGEVPDGDDFDYGMFENNFARPDHTDSEDDTPKKDSKYFYVEYYDDEDTYQKLVEFFGDKLVTKNQINHEWFAKKMLGKNYVKKDA